VSANRAKNAHIVKCQKPRSAKERHEDYVTAMYLMFCRTPNKAEPDADGMYDLSEVGSVRELKMSRMTPYSLAERCE